MLPSTPRSARSAGGWDGRPQFPTRPRSASRTRQSDYAESDRASTQPSAYRQVRPQRSMASITSNRSSEPRGRMPSLPRPPRPSTARSQPSSDASSISSSGSSFLDRMRVTAGSNASSRTSFEQDDELPQRAKPAWAPPRRKNYLEESREVYSNEENAGGTTDRGQVSASQGTSIWNRLASAAGALTVNVNMSWASNVALTAGEETPPGQESRLTRAMKAYHLEKARSPSDLPSWLFDEHERRVAPGSRNTSGRAGYDNGEREIVQERTGERRQGLRDIYDAAAASSSRMTPVSRSFRGENSESSGAVTNGGGASKASNRLKAIRDAKRSATTAGRYEGERPGSDLGEPRREAQRSETDPGRGGRSDIRGNGHDGRRAPPARIGLPGGPGKPRVRPI